MTRPSLISLPVAVTALFAVAAPAHAAGMPQFDPAAIPNQLFWLTVVFGIMFLVMWRVVIPRIGTIIEERAERVADDLARAEQHKEEADKALDAHEAVMAEADAEAKRILAGTIEEGAAETAKRSELNARAEEKVQAAEQRIAAARTEAREEIKAVATDVAAAVIAKIGHAGIDRKAIEGAVETTLQQRKAG